MMRELKFRIYDKKTKQFHYFDLNDTYAKQFFTLKEWVETPKQQMTGLKDKNGVEIYEGDIVKTPHYIMGKEPAYYENHEVKFYKGVFGFGNEHNFIELSRTEIPVESSRDYIPNFGEIWHKYKPAVEVIGNIYENKELLQS